MKTRRLFFALWPDDGVRRTLAAWQRENLPKGARATHVADLHMTLHFLGPVGEGRIARLRELGDSLVLPAFELVLDRIGCWPRPAVLWAGPPAVPGPLQAFHAQLEDGLEAAGFEREARACRPHVTLARKVRTAPQDPGFRPVRWAVREWALVESRAGERPLYHSLARWPAKKNRIRGWKTKREQTTLRINVIESQRGRVLMDDNRKKALAAALSQIEKQFGKGSVMRMGDGSAIRNIEAVSTGSLSLDIALGIGGIPKGRVIEIYGPESSGKTTLTLHCIAESQKAGGTCAFVDAEHALDPVYAEKLGVDMDELLVSQPDTGEQALEITDMLVRSGAVDLIVVDSVAALTPKAEIEGEMGDSHVGLQARLMSQALRKLTANIKKSNCIVIFINQIRMKIGVMFGSPETTTGGNALKFYSSVRLDIRRTGAIKRGDEVVGNETRVKVVKNKVAPPFKQATFEILYGEGVSREGEIIELGVALGLIEKSGAWYSQGGNRIGQGKENVRKFLKENPDITQNIEAQIRAAMFPDQQAAESEAGEEKSKS